MASDERAETAKRAELTKEKNQGHLLLTQREQNTGSKEESGNEEFKRALTE